MPSAAAERDGDPVGGSRERAVVKAHVTDIQRGVAVDAEDGVDTLDPALPDHLLRSTRDDLLGRLEDQAHPRALRRE
jgi:hypothetical protein